MKLLELENHSRKFILKTFFATIIPTILANYNQEKIATKRALSTSNDRRISCSEESMRAISIDPTNSSSTVCKSFRSTKDVLWMKS